MTTHNLRFYLKTLAIMVLKKEPRRQLGQCPDKFTKQKRMKESKWEETVSGLQLD